jgi:twitching motility protein PilT
MSDQASESELNRVPTAGISKPSRIYKKHGSSLPSLERLLRELIERDGSDLHLKVGQPPVIRIHGVLKRLDYPPLTNENVKKFVFTVLGKERWSIFLRELELDLAYNLPGVSRFRVNVFHQNDKIGAVFRAIPFQIKSIRELGLPPVVEKFCEFPRGLVLVTGPTGSGKSTTLAAMIDYINTTRSCHIITIEDPIEFLHTDKKSVVNQRELGADTKSFAAALKHVFRQTPDVILVGEMRDLETIALAITAAETGHLVFATLHTTDAAQTIDRIIDVFPPEQQAQVRLQLSNTLQAVISQTLLPRADGKGRVAAFEILVCHSGVRNLIREGKTHQIYNLIQTGADIGMRLLDDCLAELVRKGIVTYEHALAKSSNPAEFESLARRRNVLV